MELSQNGHRILKFILTNTGEKEIGQDGKEIDSPRRLNGEESAQRRFYLKAVDPIIAEKNEKMVKLIDDAKEKFKKESPKKDKEKEEEYTLRMNIAFQGDKELNKAYQAVRDEKIEVELEDKTITVIKKYFVEFGEKIGWQPGDDEFVEEIEKALI